jgi:hypothetical protein
VFYLKANRSKPIYWLFQFTATIKPRKILGFFYLCRTKQITPMLASSIRLTSQFQQHMPLLKTFQPVRPASATGAAKHSPAWSMAIADGVVISGGLSNGKREET